MNNGKLRSRMIASCLGLLLGLGVASPSPAQTGCVPNAWTEVPGGGITNGSGPAAVVNGNDLHLFVTGGGDRIYTNRFISSTRQWTGWSEIPGNGIAAGTGPAAVVYQGFVYLFVLDGYNNIYFNRLVGSFWDGWKQVPGNGVGTGGLAAAVFSPIVRPAELNLFVIGTDARIYINTLDRTAWSGWGEVPGGGRATHGPGATAFGHVYLYVRGVGGGIYQNFRDLSTGAWSGWTPVPGNGYATAGPGAAAGHANPTVVVRGLGSAVYQNQVGPGGAGQWTELPGGLASATAGPAVVAYGNTNQIFVTGPGDRLYCSATS
jgi:hypothetical protein